LFRLNIAAKAEPEVHAAFVVRSAAEKEQQLLQVYVLVINFAAAAL
jgi:hypothetical protein